MLSKLTIAKAFITHIEEAMVRDKGRYDQLRSASPFEDMRFEQVFEGGLFVSIQWWGNFVKRRDQEPTLKLIIQEVSVFDETETEFTATPKGVLTDVLSLTILLLKGCPYLEPYPKVVITLQSILDNRWHAALLRRGWALQVDTTNMSLDLTLEAVSEMPKFAEMIKLI